VSDVILGQPESTSWLIAVKRSGRAESCRAAQEAQALYSIYDTELGRSIEAREGQKENAHEPIAMSPTAIVADARREHPAKA
jgi:hypothetical protein